MHVFFVHSSITFLAAKAIISKYGLRNKEILFLTRREYSLPENSPYVSLDLTYYENQIIQVRPKGVFPIILLNYIYFKITTILLAKLSFGTNNTCYIPHSKLYIFRLISSLRFFKAFNYIEEGALYWRKDLVDKLNKSSKKARSLLMFICNNEILTANAFFIDSVDKCYLFTTNTSKIVKGEVIRMSLKDSLEDLPNINPTDSFLVCDPLNATVLSPSNDDLIVLAQVANQILSNTEGELNVKFHPGQDVVLIFKIFQEMIDEKYTHRVNFLDNSFVLEKLVSSDYDIVVLGKSSLGFYLNDNDKVFYSYVPLTRAKSEVFESFALSFGEKHCHHHLEFSIKNKWL